MRRFYIVGFTLLAAFDTVAQCCFKLAGRHAMPLEASLGWAQRLASEPWAYLAILASIGAFVIWLTLLRHAPIGPAFAAGRLEVVSVLAVSAWLFHEQISALRALGAVLILAGIVCLGVSETAPQAQKD